MSAWQSWPSRTASYTGAGPQIRWLHSYVTEDKFYCVYLASDEAGMRERLRRAGASADRVAAVRRLIHPANRT